MNDRQQTVAPAPTRHVGVVGRTETRDKGFLFVMDGTNEEHFAHKSAWRPRSLFDTVERGTAVSFLRSVTPKGWRAFDIALATADEREQIEALEENRGNR